MQHIFSNVSLCTIHDKDCYLHIKCLVGKTDRKPQYLTNLKQQGILFPVFHLIIRIYVVYFLVQLSQTDTNSYYLYMPNLKQILKPK